MTQYQHELAATFPCPFYMGRIRIFKLSELERWEKAQAAPKSKVA